MLSFCANNYLGLADSGELREAAKATLDRHGYGIARPMKSALQGLAEATTRTNHENPKSRGHRSAVTRLYAELLLTHRQPEGLPAADRATPLRRRSQRSLRGCVPSSADGLLF